MYLEGSILMKKRTVFVLILCVLLSLCPSALATGQGLSEEAPVFSGVYTMMLGFGSFTVLEAGFTKKSPHGIYAGHLGKG